MQLEVVNKEFFAADFDDDGDVDLTDYAIWKGAFNLNQLGDATGDNDLRCGRLHGVARPVGIGLGRRSGERRVWVWRGAGAGDAGARADRDGERLLLPAAQVS